MPKILMFDDDPTYAQTMVAAYEREGFNVTHAEFPPPSLIDFVLREQPDLIHCDVNMPGQSGFEAMQSVRSDPRTEGQRFYFVSTIGGRDSVETAERLGALRYFVKSQDDPQEIARFAKSIASPS